MLARCHPRVSRMVAANEVEVDQVGVLVPAARPGNRGCRQEVEEEGDHVVAVGLGGVLYPEPLSLQR
jgi:hypothetical protein